MLRKEKGLVLPAIVAIVVIFAIVGMTILTLAEQEVVLGRVEADRTKAFYLAEAGLAKMYEKLATYQALGQSVGDEIIILEESLESGTYTVVLDTNQTPCYAVATGTSGNVTKTVRAEAAFLAPPLEHAVYAMNISGIDWAFQLRGTGDPVPGWFNTEKGGRDEVNGNVFVDGDVRLYEESSVNAAPAPNPYGLNGDVEATGDIAVEDDADIAGDSTPNAEQPDIVDLREMDYEHNNTHNVAQIFNDEDISSGYLPSGHELRDVFVKNPGDRSAECGSTSDDDFFFEPSQGFIEGDYKTAMTPLHAGQDRVYYIDGDLWIHSKNDTYGFNMDGKVTIVATGNIHICDNLEYADDDSMLGLVALGKYNESGDIVSGGNIYFGDPAYGTLYTISGMMFAGKDFLYNTSSVTGQKMEPSTGFTVNGNFAAMNKVEIERDWYDKGTGWFTQKRPAHYDPQIQEWVDSETLTVLTATEQSSLRHYQMIVNYDDRVRTTSTQPPGLPRGGIKIFAGFSNWQEN